MAAGGGEQQHCREAALKTQSGAALQSGAGPSRRLSPGESQQLQACAHHAEGPIVIL